jgi:hypothetical protein
MLPFWDQMLAALSFLINETIPFGWIGFVAILWDYIFFLCRLLWGCDVLWGVQLSPNHGITSFTNKGKNSLFTQQNSSLFGLYTFSRRASLGFIHVHPNEKAKNKFA